ncbi:MAG: hypothetical protein D6768_02505 [Chloroflexi bacterium]|nr:MAG: hypothetical protein D6768_02505 [Chloroflexota bacterium]
MENLLISGSKFESIEEAVIWANRQVGRAAPAQPDFEMVKIVQFQIIPRGNFFDAVLLVELERKKSSSTMVLKMRKDMKLSRDE